MMLQQHRMHPHTPPFIQALSSYTRTPSSNAQPLPQQPPRVRAPQPLHRLERLHPRRRRPPDGQLREQRGEEGVRRGHGPRLGVPPDDPAGVELVERHARVGLNFGPAGGGKLDKIFVKTSETCHNLTTNIIPYTHKLCVYY